MVEWIAHRGNHGSKKFVIGYEENSPNLLIEAMQNGYHVETDVWFVRNYPGYVGSLWLGHDTPTYAFTEELFRAPKDFNKTCYLHAKNMQTFTWLLKNKDRYLDAGFDIFYHTTEDFVQTLKGALWMHPDKKDLSLDYNNRNEAKLIQMLYDNPDTENWLIQNIDNLTHVCIDAAEDYWNLIKTAKKSNYVVTEKIYGNI